MSWMPIRIILWLGVGLLGWVVFRALHFRRVHPLGPTNILTEPHVVRVPRWLSLLCGRPLPDNELDVQMMIAQLESLVFILVVVPAVLLGYSFLIGWVGFTAYMIAMLTQVALSLVQKRRC